MGRKEPDKIDGRMSHVKRSTNFGTSFFIGRKISLIHSEQQRLVKSLDH